MKIVIIGTNHAGIAAANTLLENYPEHEVVMLERNSNLSYLGCGTALWVGRQIDDYHGLFYTNKEAFAKKGARISIETEVTRIDFDKKIVFAHKKDGETFEETYDKLILATGSLPIEPKFPGHDLEGLHFLKLFQEGQAVDKALEDESAKNVCVIGAGYIGVEIAEAAQRRGKKVDIFDAESTSLANYYDPEFAKMMDQNLEDHGIKTHFGQFVQEYIGENGKVKAVRTDAGTFDADIVINSIGFHANTELGKDHLKLYDNGAYLVDRHFKTSDDDVYAIGDCATNYSNAIQDTTYIALASNAVRSGIVAAHNLAGNEVQSVGIQGSNAINIYNLKLVSTGLTLKAAKQANIEVDYVEHVDTQLPGFMPENHQVKLRIVFEKESRRIVGAQLASDYDASLLIHMFSLAIQEQVTIDKLALLDTFFLPHFNQPYNYVTVAALKAKK